MKSGYLFIVLYVWFEMCFARGDYKGMTPHESRVNEFKIQTNSTNRLAERPNHFVNFPIPAKPS